MLEHIHENDPSFIIAWRNKHKHQAGKFKEKVMTWDKAHSEAERLEKQHPENTYWAEHIH